MKTSPAILDDILKELKRSKREHPSYPEHICAQAAIAAAQAGGLLSAALDWKYNRPELPEAQGELKTALRSQAIATAAAAIRFIENLNVDNKTIQTA